MGQRQPGAAFMPSLFVFPGGAISDSDANLSHFGDLPQQTHDLLSVESALPPHTIAAAAIRELFEETGLVLGTPGRWQNDPDSDWRPFADKGYIPDFSALRFCFRAITPLGMPRRFDARFFVASADRIANGDIDGDGELSEISWVSREQLDTLPIASITRLVSNHVLNTTAEQSVLFARDGEGGILEEIRPKT